MSIYGYVYRYCTYMQAPTFIKHVTYKHILYVAYINMFIYFLSMWGVCQLGREVTGGARPKMFGKVRSFFYAFCENC